VIGFSSFGCPVYSAGEANVVETLLVEAQPAVLKWIQEVALKGEDYKNEVFEIFGEKPDDIDTPWGQPGSDTAEEHGEAKDKKESDSADKAEGDDGEPKSGPAGVTSEIKGDGGKPKPSLVEATPDIKDLSDVAKGVKTLKIDN
jgi:hypothetical protein